MSERDSVPPLDATRYRGDAADVRRLEDYYRIGHYLQAYEETRRRQEQRTRDVLLRDGIRLSETISPRIHRLFQTVTGRLRIEAPVEIYCLRDIRLNAFAILDSGPGQARWLVGITSAALEELDDEEIAFVIGHELGHFVCGHNRLLALLNTDPNNPAMTVLPPLGESLFLQWQKKAEFSADRVGLVAAGSLAPGLRALMKVSFGLSSKNIVLDPSTLLQQIEEIRDKPGLVQAAFASHPLLPIRLKALELFARSELAVAAGLAVEGAGLAAGVVEDEVDTLVALTRRRPVDALERIVMRLLVYGGLAALGADGDVTSDEVKILIQVLHQNFTDEPEAEIPSELSRESLSEGLRAAVADFNNHERVNDHLRGEVLRRLVNIVLADGAILEPEGRAIISIGEMLRVPQDASYQILIATAQSVGFRADARLNTAAETLSRQLNRSLGFQLAPSEGAGPDRPGARP